MEIPLFSIPRLDVDTEVEVEMAVSVFIWSVDRTVVIRDREMEEEEA
jgi:hypothetical protein